ncbi:hypothetical protein LguiB_022146 [Lonicera macranthoides]
MLEVSYFFFFMDSLILKPSKKSPLMFRMIVLTLAVVCGVYICSICLKQFSTRTRAEYVNVQVVERPCEASNIEPWEKPYLHYPKPKTFSRAECGCNPVRFFAILSTQRSGSGWFETLLNSHINGLMKHHEEIVEYFKTKGVSVIFLFRRNLLRRMVSILANSYDQNVKLLNGTHKSHVHSPHEAEILASYKPRINTTLLIPNLRQVEEMATKALECFKSTRHMILYYEDVVKNQTKLMDVQDFLRVPQRNLTSRQVKIHKGSLPQQVENWDDIQKALNGTPYERFLHADYKLLS